MGKISNFYSARNGCLYYYGITEAEFPEEEPYSGDAREQALIVRYIRRGYWILRNFTC